MDKKIAIIDIGSNTIRLVIYREKAENFFKPIENIKVSARLLNFLDREQMITADGLNILVKSLKIFKQVASLHEVSSITAVATAAIRQAKNQQEIKQTIHDEIGFSVDILSGEREAHYGFLGIINATYLKDGVTIDIGGGSTEITLFLNRKMVFSHSLPFGVLTLNQKFVSAKIPTLDELSTLSSFLDSQFKGINWLKNARLPIIGIGGTARILGKLHQVMQNYQLDSVHLYEMNLQDIFFVKEKIESLPLSELQNLEGLPKDRADIIIPAIQAFVSMYKCVNAPFFQLSQKGIRDGILYQELRHSNKDNLSKHPLSKSLHELAIEYDIDLEKRMLVQKTALIFIESLRRSAIAGISVNDLNHLKTASSLYNLGEFIEDEAAFKHTFYILSNRNIDGLSHRERIKVALLASYNSKASFKQHIKPFKEWFSKHEREKLRIMGALLKLSYILNKTKRDIVVDAKFLDGKDHIDLVVYCNKSWQVEQPEAEKQIKHLQNAIGRIIKLHFKLMV